MDTIAFGFGLIAGLVFGVFFMMFMFIKYPQITYQNVWFIFSKKYVPQISEMFSGIPNMTVYEIPDKREGVEKKVYMNICLTGWFNFDGESAQNYKHDMIDKLRARGVEIQHCGVN